MTDIQTVPVSGHQDPEGQVPWAMQMVVRSEKTDPPNHTNTLEAAAMAAVLLIHTVDKEGTEEQRASVARWEQGRIRKVVRRAKGSAWEKAVTSSHCVVVQHGTSEVAAFLPQPVNEVPKALSGLQVSGLDLEDTGAYAQVMPTQKVCVYLNPHVALSTGKAAAQVAHAAQLVWSSADSVKRDLWVESGTAITVVTAQEDAWDFIVENSQVQIHDAGFTEIPSGTLTCVASFSM